MNRSLGICAGVIAGIAIGFFLGRVLSPLGSNTRTAVVSQELGQSKQPSSEGAGRDLSETIVLGKITTVPFQELYGLLGRRSQSEIAAIASQLGDLPDGPDKNERVRTFFKAWAHLDPSAALSAALTFNSVEARRGAIAATVEGADAAAAPTLAESIKRLPESVISAQEKSGLLGAAVEKWSEIDPPAAADFLDRTPSAAIGFTMAFNQVTRKWAARDPVAAMYWAIAHSTGPHGATALTGAITGWWEKDPAAAEAFATAHADEANGQQLMSAIASELVQQDPRKAAAWADTLPAADDRRMGYALIAMQWAMSDPGAAASWAAGLPNEVQSTALDSSVSLWANTNPQAAAQWIQSLSGPARDEAVATYIAVALPKDPAAAAAWAISIEDPGKRISALKGVLPQWMQRDPNAARTWIQNSSLGEAEKAKLLAAPTPRP